MILKLLVQSNRKGIILAGGYGKRLYPATSSINKHLFLVYDKPMIYYPLTTLMLCGIKDILIVSSPKSVPLLKNLLGDGHSWGIKLSYVIQNKPEGIAKGILLGEEFISQGNSVIAIPSGLF